MELMQKFLSTPFDFLKDYGGPFILVLSVLVFVHEWGHYIVARLCGVRIEKFSIGFGPEMFGWTDKRGCRWKFSWIPLGGYVQMFGDTDPASARHAEGVKEKGAEKARPFTAAEKKVAFFFQPVSRRAAIVVAGPAINYLFAILILTGLYVAQGQPYVPPIAASVLSGSAAEKAGIRPDDKIVAVDGVKIASFNDLKKIVVLNLDKEMELTVLRSTGKKGQWRKKPVMLKAKPRLEMEVDRFGFRHATGKLGIVGPSSAFEMRPHNLFSALFSAAKETWSITSDTLRALGQMIMGTRSTEELGGILRIGAYAGEFAQAGWISFITFAALLSVNLGLVNLLPIPMLDGGHLALYAAEAARGKPVSERTQEYALRAGLAFLLGVMLLATWNDLVQLKFFDYVMKLVS